MVAKAFGLKMESTERVTDLPAHLSPFSSVRRRPRTSNDDSSATARVVTERYFQDY